MMEGVMEPFFVVWEEPVASETALAPRLEGVAPTEEPPTAVESCSSKQREKTLGIPIIGHPYTGTTLSD